MFTSPKSLSLSLNGFVFSESELSGGLLCKAEAPPRKACALYIVVPVKVRCQRKQIELRALKSNIFGGGSVGVCLDVKDAIRNC